MNKPMTIKRLNELTSKIVQSGYGDSVIYIGEDIVCDDDYCFRPTERKFEFRGYLYNMKDYERFKIFESEMREAWKKIFNGRD